MESHTKYDVCYQNIIYPCHFISQRDMSMSLFYKITQTDAKIHKLSLNNISCKYKLI